MAGISRSRKPPKGAAESSPARKRWVSGREAPEPREGRRKFRLGSTWDLGSFAPPALTESTLRYHGLTAVARIYRASGAVMLVRGPSTLVLTEGEEEKMFTVFTLGLASPSSNKCSNIFRIS